MRACGQRLTDGRTDALLYSSVGLATRDPVRGSAHCCRNEAWSASAAAAAAYVSASLFATRPVTFLRLTKHSASASPASATAASASAASDVTCVSTQHECPVGLSVRRVGFITSFMLLQGSVAGGREGGRAGGRAGGELVDVKQNVGRYCMQHWRVITSM